MQRILLELLNQMDGFDRNDNVKVCAQGLACGAVLLMRGLCGCLAAMLRKFVPILEVTWHAHGHMYA